MIQETKSMRTVVSTSKTLVENGASLPIGIPDRSGAINRSIEVRPWRMKEERELGAIIERLKGSRVSQYVPSVLSVMCTRLGPHDLSAMKEVERQIIISQMWMADVFFAYMWLRVQTMGETVGMDLHCPACMAEIPFVADLNTMAVRSVEKAEDAQWWYDVRKPFQARNKEAKRLLIGPPRWATLENMSDQTGKNPGELKAAMINGSVIQIEGIEGQLVLAHNEMDEMHKVDFEQLATMIDVNAVGADLSVEASCKKCKQDFRASIDWTGEGFFGAPSRSNQQT